MRARGESAEDLVPAERAPIDPENLFHRDHGAEVHVCTAPPAPHGHGDGYIYAVYQSIHSRRSTHARPVKRLVGSCGVRVDTGVLWQFWHFHGPPASAYDTSRALCRPGLRGIPDSPPWRTPVPSERPRPRLHCRVPFGPEKPARAGPIARVRVRTRRRTFGAAVHGEARGCVLRE